MTKLTRMLALWMAAALPSCGPFIVGEFVPTDSSHPTRIKPAVQAALAQLPDTYDEYDYLVSRGQLSPKVLDQLPQAYLDRLPAQPYKPVGLLRLEGHNLNIVLYYLRRRAAQVGCDFIIDRKIHRVTPASSQMNDRRRWVARHGFIYVRPAVVITSPPPPAPPVHEYICGVYSAPTPTSTQSSPGTI